MKKGAKTILFDMDHTLVDASPRDHMITHAMLTGEWDAYHAAAIFDAPAHDAVALYRVFRAAQFIIIGITARPAKWRALTQQWLDNANVSFDDLLMRPDDEFRPSAALKIDLAREYFKGKVKENVLFIVDDHPDVTDVFRKEGITALMIKGMDYNV